MDNMNMDNCFMASQTHDYRIVTEGGNYRSGFFSHVQASISSDLVTFQFHSTLQGAMDNFSMLNMVRHPSIVHTKSFIQPCKETNFRAVIVLERCDSLEHWLKEKKSYQMGAYLNEKLSGFVRLLLEGLNNMHEQGYGGVNFNLEHIRVVDEKPKLCLAMQLKSQNISEQQWTAVKQSDFYNFRRLLSMIASPPQRQDNAMYKHLSSTLLFEGLVKGMDPYMLGEHPFLMTEDDKRKLLYKIYDSTKDKRTKEDFIYVLNSISCEPWEANLKRLSNGDRRKYQPFMDSIQRRRNRGKVDYGCDARSFMRFCRNFVAHRHDFKVTCSLDEVFDVFDKLWPFFTYVLKKECWHPLRT